MKAWEQIVDAYLFAFEQGQFQAQDKLPSEHTIRERYNTTRIEVRKAMTTLKDLGYITSLQGKGYFYNGQQERIRLNLQSDISFTKKLSFLKERFYTSVVDCERILCDEEIARQLHIEAQQPVFCIRRLRVIDHIPSAMHISYIQEERFPDVKQFLTKTPSLYEYFITHDYIDTHCTTRSFTISTLNHEERTLMKASGIVPCMVLTSTNYHRVDESVIEYAKIIYRGDRFIFEINNL